MIRARVSKTIDSGLYHTTDQQESGEHWATSECSGPALLLTFIIMYFCSPTVGCLMLLTLNVSLSFTIHTILNKYHIVTFLYPHCMVRLCSALNNYSLVLYLHKFWIEPGTFFICIYKYFPTVKFQSKLS